MRLACVQASVVYGNPNANTKTVIDEIERCASGGVDLIAFPEAFLTGYCAWTAEEADSLGIYVDDPNLERIRERCETLDVMAVVGFIENADGIVYNTAALFEPGRPIRFYRKVHLPYLGVDRFTHPGDELPLFDTRLGRLAILVCFDLRIPEAARVLALKGADLLLVPTNWPEGAEVSADHISIARAAENRMFVATINRVGEENGFNFIGRSKVIHPGGEVLASAKGEPTTLIVDIDISESRQKRMVRIPGIYETDAFATRQPDLYKPLMEFLTPEEPS